MVFVVPEYDLIARLAARFFIVFGSTATLRIDCRFGDCNRGLISHLDHLSKTATLLARPSRDEMGHFQRPISFS